MFESSWSPDGNSIGIPRHGGRLVRVNNIRGFEVFRDFTVSAIWVVALHNTTLALVDFPFKGDQHWAGGNEDDDGEWKQADESALLADGESIPEYAHEGEGEGRHHRHEEDVHLVRVGGSRGEPVDRHTECRKDPHDEDTPAELRDAGSFEWMQKREEKCCGENKSTEMPMDFICLEEGGSDGGED